MTIEEQAAQVNSVKRSENGMIADPVTLSKDHTLAEAKALMANYKISGLPVVDQNNYLIGIITNRDVKYQENLDIKVEEIMTKENLITSDKSTTLEDAKKILLENRIEKLPIVDAENHLVGLITIKETITLAQAEKLSALTTGVVTATIAPATATDLLDATFKATDVLSVTVKGTYTATNLIDLDTANGISKISLSNKAQALTVDAGDVAALVTALDNTGYKGNVTVTGATAIDIDDLQALNKLTTVKITLNDASLADTASYSETAANLVEAFAGITGLKGDVTISSAANTVTIAELKAINKATSGEITVTNDQTLSGSAKDLVEALKDVTLTAASTVVVKRFGL
jgi:CBS domain-containing protein